MTGTELAEIAACLTAAGTIAQVVEDNSKPGGVAWRVGKGLSAILPELKGVLKALGPTAAVVALTPLWLVMACLGAHALVACASQSPQLTALQQSEVATYGQQELACVTDSATRAQAVACIAKVQAQWCSSGAPLQEQGACGEAGPRCSTG